MIIIKGKTNAQTDINKIPLKYKLYAYDANTGDPITLEEELDVIAFPACPTDTDGTYVLEATVSDGAVTYTWVLKSS